MSNDLTDKVSALEHELRERYARAAWTHKTHEKDADRYHRFHVWLVWGKIILSALASSSSTWAALSANIYNVIAALLSGLLLLINIIFENRNFELLAREHRDAAAKMLGIREDWLSLITRIRMPSPDVEKIFVDRDKILDHWKRVVSSLPRTSPAAYAAATKALHGDELNFSDSEIDHLLAPAFRIGEG